VLRDSKNIKQGELAKAIGITNKTISMIETGQRAASIEVIDSLANYFNVPVDYLTGSNLFAKFEEIIENRQQITDSLLKDSSKAGFNTSSLLPTTSILQGVSDIDFVLLLSVLLSKIELFDDAERTRIVLHHKY